MTEDNVKMIVRHFDIDDPRIGADVADRILATGILEFLGVVLEELETELGWDIPPIYANIYQNGRSPLGEGDIAQLLLELRPVPAATPALMMAERPHHAVVMLAHNVQDSPLRMAIPPDMVALTLITEAWRVTAPPGDDAAIAQLKKDGEEHTIHLREDRIEVKQACAVDINGVVYMAQRRRDGKKDVLCTMAGHADGYAGNVPNSLEYLMLSYQGKTLPRFNEWCEQQGRTA